MSTTWDGQGGRCGAGQSSAAQESTRQQSARQQDTACRDTHRNDGRNDRGGGQSRSTPSNDTAPVPRTAAKPVARHDPLRHAFVQDSPPLHAALDYRARRLCAAIDARVGNAADNALLDRLRPAGAQLLRWWCSATACRMRVDNFNALQRQALLHALLAHDILRSDDAGQLYRRACDPRSFENDDRIADDAHYRLRLAPGSGLRWVLQALLVWRWANAVDAPRDASPRTPEFTLIAATPDLARRLRTALLGDDRAAGSGSGHHRIDGSSLLRHAQLFLPPALRAPFRAWLQAQRDGEGALRILAARDAPAEMSGGDRAPAWCLIERGHRAQGDAMAITSTITPTRLRIDLHVAVTADADAHAAIDAAIVDMRLSQAIRRGACKLPVLEAVDIAGLPLRAKPSRRTGLRPRLSRAHRHLLATGLRALRQREDGFAALDPARRPRLLVLCTAPLLMRATRRWLIDAGVAEDAGRAQIELLDGRLLDGMPVDVRLCDARICVVVVLRADRIAGARRIAMVATVAGAALLWPEPDFADLRSENVERAALDRPPRHLIDALSIVDDPRCLDEYAAVTHARGATAAVPATDDLFSTGLREDAALFDMTLPAPCDGAPRIPPERLSDLPRRILRARHALPVAKSVHAHAPCSALDSGLRRALLECAEADPAIDSHCLLDPRRHGAHGREAWLARGASTATSMGMLDTRGWPDALVRTADRIYLVELLPFCPTAPHAPGPSERAMLRWLRQLDARPPEQRGHRRWFRAPLPAPLFWSWKRSGGTLSALLAMLADAALHGHAPRRG
jgi:hypothetical protein